MLDTIFAALKLAGVKTPAFDALFHAVLGNLSASDQEAAQSAYAAARAEADAAQDDFVDAGRGN